MPVTKAARVAKTPDPEHYSYMVAWSPDDGVYVARALEFPGLTADGEDSVSALAAIREVVTLGIEVLVEEGKPVPQPISERQFSGKVLLRIGTELHRKLALDAERAGVSLKAMMTQRLSRGT